MDTIDFNNIKFKPLDESKIIISVDRLTRFKETEEKYLRVFKDILTNNLISPKFKKSELDNLNYTLLSTIATYILNESLKIIVKDDISCSYKVNKGLQEYENNVFNLSKNTQELLNNNINYDRFLPLIGDKSPNNLKWIREMLLSDEPDLSSHTKGYHFPVEKVLICEGITEEILLPVFAKLLDYDFDKNGVHIISAGGKNQVVKLYYSMAEKLKLPAFVLLDSDAKENGELIKRKLRGKDCLYILKKGEFEDLLPIKLIEKSLNASIKNISETPVEHYNKSGSAVEYLEEFYRTRGKHEFKKAEFAQIVKENISGADDVSDEFRKIIVEIKNIC